MSTKSIPNDVQTMTSLRDAIIQVHPNHMDPIVGNFSPKGTSADRRYLFGDTYAAGYFTEQTIGPRETIRHLVAILMHLTQNGA